MPVDFLMESWLLWLHLIGWWVVDMMLYQKISQWECVVGYFLMESTKRTSNGLIQDSWRLGFFQSLSSITIQPYNNNNIQSAAQPCKGLEKVQTQHKGSLACVFLTFTVGICKIRGCVGWCTNNNSRLSGRCVVIFDMFVSELFDTFIIPKQQIT